MQFSEIPGHSTLKSKLIENVETNKLPHALLFLGEEGSANLALALALAQYVNCHKPSPQDSCGTCPSCRFMQKKAHPDLHFSYPFVAPKGKKSDSVTANEYRKQWREALLENIYLNEYQWIQKIDPENKKGNINKAECLEIIKFTGLKTNSNYKIIIIWKPEKLDKIGNVLLKTIEEPPQKTLILLVANETESIIGTILSRTQRINVAPINDAELQQFLTSQFDQNSPNLQLLRLSNGNIGKALQLMNAQTEDEDNNNEERLALWLRFCIKKEVLKIHEWIEETAKLGRENQKNFLAYFSQFYNLALRTTLTGVSSSNLTQRETQMAQFMLRYAAWNDMEQWNSTLENAHFYINRNANPKLLFFNLSLDLMHLMSKK